jgi:hypothetical protein
VDIYALSYHFTKKIPLQRSRGILVNKTNKSGNYRKW